MIKVAVSGYFNPFHKGHLSLIKHARTLGDYVIVIVNNDEQVKLKGSKPFMDQEERCTIMRSIKGVDEVVLSVDKDRTVRKTLSIIKPNIFAKGGDSTPDNVPELDVCRKYDIEVVFGIGGGKIQSSSWLLKS